MNTQPHTRNGLQAPVVIGRRSRAVNISTSPEALDRGLCQQVYSELTPSLWIASQSARPRFYPRINSHQLTLLEYFIDDLLADDSIPFLPRWGSTAQLGQYDISPLAFKHFALVPEYIDVVNMLSVEYDYNEHITVFRACVETMGLNRQNLDWRHTFRATNQKYLQLGGQSAAELFNALVFRLRTECRTTKIKSKIRQRRVHAEDTFIEKTRYVDAWFEVCVRLVAVRVDLYYKKEFFGQVSAQQAIDDLNHLVENHRCNAIFAYKKAYIAKLEYGVDKGLHFHVLYLFDGSHRKPSSHVHFAKEIGEYWVNTITKGRGDYWNCNAHFRDYEKKGILGIGEINAHQTHLRDNLKNRVIRYMCKSSQFLKPKAARGLKLIRSGQFPKVGGKKLGRPRVLSGQGAASAEQDGCNSVAS